MRKHIDEMISNRVDVNLTSTLEDLSPKKSSWITNDDITRRLREKVANDYSEGLKLFEKSADIMADSLIRHEMVCAAKGAFDASKEMDSDPNKNGDEEFVAVELQDVANKALEVAAKSKKKCIVDCLVDRQFDFDLTKRKESLKCLLEIKKELVKTYAKLTSLILDLHDIKFLLQENGWEYYEESELEELEDF